MVRESAMGHLSRLSADTLGVTTSMSSVTKGETLIDTAKTLEAMQPDMIVIRHASAGAPELLSRDLRGELTILAGLEEFREHLGGELTVTPRVKPNAIELDITDTGVGIPPEAQYPASLAECEVRRQTPEVGAGCLNWARPYLCGGRPERAVPTATTCT